VPFVIRLIHPRRLGSLGFCVRFCRRLTNCVRLRTEESLQFFNHAGLGRFSALPGAIPPTKSHGAGNGLAELSNVNNLALKRLVSEMAEANFAPKTISNFAQVVKMVVGSAIGEDGEELYPQKWNHEFIDLPDVAGQRTPSFTSGEVQQIVLRANGQFAVLYALLAATGLRVGEALALEVAHFHDGSLTIRQSIWNGRLQSPKTKSGSKEVDLTWPAAAMLENFIDGRKKGFIFRASNGSALAQSNVLRRSLHPILASMKREKTGFHSFRRFRVTHLRKHGTPQDLLRFWIGHGDKTVTDRYAKLSEDVAFRKAQAERVGSGLNLEVVPRCPQAFENGDNAQVVVM
jgi:site-specific recombinase XerD